LPGTAHAQQQLGRRQIDESRQAANQHAQLERVQRLWRKKKKRPIASTATPMPATITSDPSSPLEKNSIFS